MLDGEVVGNLRYVYVGVEGCKEEFADEPNLYGSQHPDFCLQILLY